MSSVRVRSKPKPCLRCNQAAFGPSRLPAQSRAFRNKAFARFARRERIGNRTLCDALKRIGSGLVDADLGGGVVKQPLARPGQSRSGGIRAILVLRRGERAFFVHGFAKGDRPNLRRTELRAVRTLAEQLLGQDETALGAMLANGTISEVICDDQTIRK